MLLLFPMYTCDIFICVLPSPHQNIRPTRVDICVCCYFCAWHPTGSQTAHMTQPPGTTPHRMLIKNILN